MIAQYRSPIDESCEFADRRTKALARAFWFQGSCRTLSCFLHADWNAYFSQHITKLELIRLSKFCISPSVIYWKTQKSFFVMTIAWSRVAVRVLVRVNMHDVTSHVWRHQIKILKVKFIIGKSPSDIYGNKIRNTNFMGFRLILKKKLDTSPSVVYGKKSRHECSEWFFCHL